MRDRSLLRNHPSLGHEISTRLRPPPEAQEARPAEVHQRRFSVSSHGQHALQPGRELFLLVFGQNHSGLRRLNELKFKKNGHRAARRGLAPLNAAARDASRIGMDSLNQRFPEGEMPIEVLPFVKAVNEALTRLDAGVARQGRFTANAAHELRTPIAILDARADAVNDDALKREIKRDVRRMQTVVDQLLLLARRSSNEDDDAPSIDLGEAVRSIAGNYLPIHDRKWPSPRTRRAAAAGDCAHRPLGARMRRRQSHRQRLAGRTPGRLRLDSRWSGSRDRSHRSRRRRGARRS